MPPGAGVGWVRRLAWSLAVFGWWGAVRAVPDAPDTHGAGGGESGVNKSHFFTGEVQVSRCDGRVALLLLAWSFFMDHHVAICHATPPSHVIVALSCCECRHVPTLRMQWGWEGFGVVNGQGPQGAYDA